MRLRIYPLVHPYICLVPGKHPWIELDWIRFGSILQCCGPPQAPKADEPATARKLDFDAVFQVPIFLLLCRTCCYASVPTQVDACSPPGAAALHGFVDRVNLALGVWSARFLLL